MADEGCDATASTKQRVDGGYPSVAMHEHARFTEAEMPIPPTPGR